MLRKYLLPLLAVFLLGFAVLHVVAAHRQPPKLAPPVDAAATPYRRPWRGPASSRPMTENISIGSALPGVVLEVFVPVEKVGTAVKKGEPLFRVDDRQLKAAAQVSTGDLDAAEAAVGQARSDAAHGRAAAERGQGARGRGQLAHATGPGRASAAVDTSRALSAEDVQAARNDAGSGPPMQLAQTRPRYQLLKAGAGSRTSGSPGSQLALAGAGRADETEIEAPRLRARIRWTATSCRSTCGPANTSARSQAKHWS